MKATSAAGGPKDLQGPHFGAHGNQNGPNVLCLIPSSTLCFVVPRRLVENISCRSQNAHGILAGRRGIRSV